MNNLRGFAALSVLAVFACTSGDPPDQAESAEPVLPPVEAEAADPPAEAQPPADDPAAEEEMFYVAYGEEWVELRDGLQLSMLFDASGRLFTGTLVNRNEGDRCEVLVTVRIEGGPELPPLELGRVASGDTARISVPSSREPVATWNAEAGGTACGLPGPAQPPSGPS